MTKLCPRGKSAAKRKFKVYPSAYANAYASKICAGKIKDPSGTKRKDFKGPKPAGKRNGGIMEKEKYTDKQISRINKARSDQMRMKGPSVQVGGKKPGLLKSNKAKERGGNRIGSKNKRRFASGGLAKKGRGCEIR
jgi:hypothetical protein